MDHQCRCRDLIFFGECVFLHMYHVSFLCVPCLIPTWAMTLSYVCHDSFLCGTWIICMCTMTHIYVYHDSWTISVVLETWAPSKKKNCMPGLIFVCVPHHSMTHIYVYNGSHWWVWRISYVCHDSHLSVECVMDQSFKDVISQQRNMSVWKRKRNSSSAYVFTHTHTHIHIRIRTRTHTHMYTHSAYRKSNQNRTRVKRVKSLRIFVPQDISILLRPENNSSKHCSKE